MTLPKLPRLRPSSSSSSSSLCLLFGLLHSSLLLLFLPSALAYTIDPEMKCAVEGSDLSFVIRINITAENSAFLHADDADVSEKAYIEKNGSRCAESKAEKVDDEGRDQLKIHAPLLKCGSVETQANGNYKYEAKVKIETAAVIVTTNHLFTLSCILNHEVNVTLPNGIEINNPDFCMNDPCFNGGECESTKVDYICTCKVGFAGKDCSSAASLFSEGVAMPLADGVTNVEDFSATKTTDDQDCKGRNCILTVNSGGDRIRLSELRPPFKQLPAWDQVMTSAVIHRNGLVHLKGNLNDYNNPVPWKELGKIDKDMVLLSPFWSDFATSTTDNAAKVKVRQYSESELVTAAAANLTAAVKASFKEHFEAKRIEQIRYVLAVRWEDMLAPGNAPNNTRMSFEMVVVSDQLRTFVGFNYAEVNVNKGVQDVFGGVFPSKLGYFVTKSHASLMPASDTEGSFQSTATTFGDKCKKVKEGVVQNKKEDGKVNECLLGFFDVELSKVEGKKLSIPYEFFAWALDQRDNAHYQERKKKRRALNPDLDEGLCYNGAWESKVVNCPCELETDLQDDGKTRPNERSPRLSSYTVGRNRKSFESDRFPLEYHISDHMIPYLKGDYHKDGDSLGVKANIDCYRLCGYSMATDAATSASLKRQSSNVWGGITCVNYPTNSKTIGFESDQDVWDLIQEYPELVRTFRSCRPVAATEAACESKTPPASQATGDPHITTFDNLVYTFNGLGEYTLARVLDANQKAGCEIQARTGQPNLSGTTVKATIFTAFLLTCPKEFNDMQSIEIKLNGKDTGFDVSFVQSKKDDPTSATFQTFSRFHQDSDFSESNTAAGFTIFRVNVKNSKEYYVLINYGNPKTLILEVRYNAEQKALIPLTRANSEVVGTEGLLGKKNGAIENDLMPKGGSTPLATDSTDKEIYEGFGETWRITKADSVWPRNSGETWETFNDVSFKPLFYEEIPWNTIGITQADALSVCDANRQCAFDRAVTGLESFAKATGAAASELENRRRSDADEAPAFTSPSSTDNFVVTVGSTNVMKLNVADVNNDTVVLTLSSTLGGTVSFTPTDGPSVEADLTWTPTDSTFSGNIVFEAVANKKTVTHTVPILFCDCNNALTAGTCNNNQIRTDATTSIKYATCTCDEEWEGDLCQKDVDRCGAGDIGAVKCGSTANCRDIPAATAREWRQKNNGIKIQYTCTGCSTGFGLQKFPGGDALEASTCADVDECTTGSNACVVSMATCFNLEGSYRCDCKTGYKRGGDSLTCEDIDECASGTSNCEQACENTAGSFECKCFSGYVMDSAGKCTATVNKICETKKCSEANGVKFCRAKTDDSLTAECFCPSGLVLDADETTCIDVNECTADLQKCSSPATCANEVLTLANIKAKPYRCECSAGNKLNDDGFSCTGCRDINQWKYGNECSQECQCRERGSCDPAAGCQCPTGYNAASGLASETCSTDVDECTTNPTICNVKQHSVCENTVGSYKCVCMKGFTDNQGTCENINECDQNVCDDNANCVDKTPTDADSPTHTCTCKSGFSGNGVTCSSVSINECLTNPCDGNAECIDTASAYECKCNQGYVGNGKSCGDVNECCPCDNPTNIDSCIDEAQTCKCHEDATCANIIGSFNCTCKNGYKGDGKSCTDINECLTNNGGCHSEATCTNTPGSFTCACRLGYTGDGKSCTDTLECDLNLDDCNVKATCNDTVGSYSCTCRAGYSGTGRGSNGCANENECLANPCNNKQDCVDNEGSYVCNCKTGFTKNGEDCDDVNECSTDPLQCTPPSTCTNTPGSYICESATCGSGEEYDVGKDVCKDIDECVNGQADCAATGSTCTNTAGSFTCNCSSGYEGDGKTCTDIKECVKPADNNCDANATCSETLGSYTCKCNDGYSGNGTTCTDIDECAGNPCHANAKCSDLVNDYSCECKDGFKPGSGVKDKLQCQNYDQCTEPGEDNGCHADANCIDDIGSFKCECKSGYSGNGQTCTNIDECTPTNLKCDGNSVCKDNPGSYKCNCKSGYEQVDQNSCKDIDECKGASGGCDASNGQKCTNTAGSYSCSCVDGYEVEGTPSDVTKIRCIDKNECDDVAVNECEAGKSNCTNTVGGYSCLYDHYTCVVTPDNLKLVCQCSTGFSGNNENTKEKIVCTDIDECNRGENPCDREQGEFTVCNNTPGNFECLCQTGWQPQPVRLPGSNNYLGASSKFCNEDIDECLKKPTPCFSEESTCTNTAPGFTCKCPAGYTGNGIGPNNCANVDECEGNPCSAVAECSDTVGSFNCACRDGFAGTGVGEDGCDIQQGQQVAVQMRILVEGERISTNDVDRPLLQKTLHDIFKAVPDFSNVTIMKIRNGSVAITFGVETNGVVDAAGIQTIAKTFTNHLENTSDKLAGVPGGTVNRNRSTIITRYGTNIPLGKIVKDSCLFINDCSGNGKCTDETQCDCNDGYTGDKCQTIEEPPPTGLSDTIIAIIAVVCVVGFILLVIIVVVIIISKKNRKYEGRDRGYAEQGPQLVRVSPREFGTARSGDGSYYPGPSRWMSSDFWQGDAEGLDNQGAEEMDPNRPYAYMQQQLGSGSGSIIVRHP